jgi:hypothetical protein
MIHLLDTNTCIRYLNGQSESIRRQLESRLPREIVLCSVVKAELFFGAFKSANPDKNLGRLDRFTAHFVSSHSTMRQPSPMVRSAPASKDWERPLAPTTF